MLTRRHAFFAGTAGLAALVCWAAYLGACAAKRRRPTTKSPTPTRSGESFSSPEAYEVLRHEGTERPFTSKLLDEHRAGTFTCAGCDLPLYSSKTKFDSGTGWPSFWAPLDKAVDRNAGHLVRHDPHGRVLQPLRRPSRPRLQ